MNRDAVDPRNLRCVAYMPPNPDNGNFVKPTRSYHFLFISAVVGFLNFEQRSPSGLV